MIAGRCFRSGLIAVALFAATASAAVGGIDVSLEREYQRLQDIERRVAEFPAYRESEDIKQQISELQSKFEGLSGSDPDIVDLERETLRKQIGTLERRLNELSKIVVEFRAQLATGESRRFFPDVRHRIAAFTFDDPDDTGLGDPISFLLAKKLLFSTRVSSFAIVNYREGTGRDATGDLAYFDRVDAITAEQRFLLAIWGRISPTNDGARIDAYLQVPADAKGGPYVHTIRLPEAMGSGMLTARLRPNRIQVQSLELSADKIGYVQEAATEVATLRAEPSIGAEPTGQLAEDRPYRIVNSQGEWVELSYSDGDGGGWTSVDAFCTGACRDLLDTATYANDLVATTAGLTPRPTAPTSTREARAMLDQLEGLVSLNDDPRRALAIADRWESGDGTRGLRLPGGAGFANLLAIAKIAAELERSVADGNSYDSVRLDREETAAIASDLARASVADPSDVDLLTNLAALFEYLGDTERRDLALEIAADLETR